MLKEYRICMPMSVEEYNIGQLYMIARHSAEQSDGGEGVEVIANRPHTSPTHGTGQFTEKRIHLSGKLPAWARSYTPRFIYVTEKAWNYYPYTETEYTCSVIPRLSIKIRTRYENNCGSSDNCLGVEEEEMKQRIVDHVDILTDPVDERHYKKEEDPSTFKSEKTGRGPLQEGWKENSEVIMCSYKLVDVSFQVFGLQTRVEDYIHRVIRNVLVVGHRQAFAWIDEWHGMTLQDVRDYETGMQEDTNDKIRAAQKSAGISVTKENVKSSEEEENEEEEDSGKDCNGQDSADSEERARASTTTSPTSSAKGGYLSFLKWS